MTYITNNFPTSIQTGTDPVEGDAVATFDHAGLESFQNDSIKALKTKVGADSSADTTSFDYKLSEITGSDKAVGKSAAQTLLNKILTTPTIASFINALHTHLDSTGGGTLSAAAIASGTIGTARLGSGSATSSTYLSGDQTWKTITAGSTATTVLPSPVSPAGSGVIEQGLSTFTTMNIGRINIHDTVIVNKVWVNISSYASSGTFKIGLWSSDGTTQILTGTSGTVSGNALTAVTLGSPITVAAGQYYFGAVGVSGSFAVGCFDTASDTYGTRSGKPTLEGTYTVTSGTIPSTLTLASVTQNQAHTPRPVFDN